ncbi:MAG TPA: NUDIX hydrolase [Beijerinckiaceae bacterium]
MKTKPESGSGRQVAALPWRGGAKVEVMLITSLDTGRWIIPKGWPMKGKPDNQAAAREAYEEAGLVGAVAAEAIGSYHYDKRRKNGSSRRCVVDVYPLAVEKQRRNWPEKGKRRLKWFSGEEAAALVDDPELAQLIAAFSRPPEA